MSGTGRLKTLARPVIPVRMSPKADAPIVEGHEYWLMANGGWAFFAIVR